MLLRLGSAADFADAEPLEDPLASAPAPALEFALVVLSGGDGDAGAGAAVLPRDMLPDFAR